MPRKINIPGLEALSFKPTRYSVHVNGAVVHHV